MTNQISTVSTFSSEDIVCVALDIHLWSARIQLKAEDLQKYNASFIDLPDAALASLGSIKLCDPEVIRRFERLKREAHQLLETAGLPLFGVRAIPKSKFNEVRIKLEDIKYRFADEANRLLATYDSLVSDWRTTWEAKNPGYGLLLDRIPKAEAVFGRLSFDFHAYQVTSPKGVDEANEDFNEKLTGLRGELYKDAARESMILLEESFVKEGSKRDYITPKTLGPFKRIAARFRDFEFLDSTAIAAAELIESTVSQALQFAQSDKKGRIADGALMLVYAMANTFANPRTAIAIAEKSKLEGNQSAWDHLMSIGEVSTKVEAEVDAHKANEVCDGVFSEVTSSEPTNQTVVSGLNNSLETMEASFQNLNEKSTEINISDSFLNNDQFANSVSVIDVDSRVVASAPAQSCKGIDLLSLF